MPLRVYRGTTPKIVPVYEDESAHPTFKTVNPGDTLELSDEAAERLDTDAPNLFVEPERVEVRRWRDLR